jgi:hypothetical protein
MFFNFSPIWGSPVRDGRHYTKTILDTVHAHFGQSTPIFWSHVEHNAFGFSLFSPAFAGPASWANFSLPHSRAPPTPLVVRKFKHIRHKSKSFLSTKNKMVTFKNFNNQLSIYSEIVNRNSEDKFK